MKVFIETQRFDQWWFRLIILLIAIISIGTIAKSYQNVQSEPVPFWISLIAGLCTLIIILSVGFLIKLETKIDELGIHYGFWPFYSKLKLIPWSDIEKCTIRKYNPLVEYGGWGYRMGFFQQRGSAMNVKGNIGIQIVFKNGKHLLIGTQKKEDAEKVIKTYTHKLKSHAD
jgi:hypothetical protein|tara:strand:+ start:376 stop:888 length:513 start_codon:yes stop_codon:yes gene_type:complete